MFRVPLALLGDNFLKCYVLLCDLGGEVLDEAVVTRRIEFSG